jgi:hypothetical protein
MFMARRVFAPSLFVALALGSTACEKGPLTDPGGGLEGRYVTAALPSMPSPTSYTPATQRFDQAKFCKDASSPAGTYTATISASNTQAGDQVAASATLSPGECTIIFNRTDHTTSYNNFALVTITEVVAGGASYRVRNVAVNDFDGARFTGATATVKVNGYHGAVANYTNEVVPGGPPSLAHIFVTPNPAFLLASATQQFVAVGRDGSGDIFPITPVWTVTNATAGSINAGTGLFTAGTTPGTYTNAVRATSGAVFGEATVTVQTVAPFLATITVTPNPASVVINATRQFVAVGRDQNNNIFPITPTPVWTVTNATAGSINAGTGLFTAGTTPGTYTNAVRATSGSVFGTATVIVTAAAPPPPLVDLGTAALNGIMAGTAVTCVTGGIINANVSISPGSTITGFGPCVITGVQHLNDAVAIQNQIDLTNAYNTLAGLPCPGANAIVANLGGTTKNPGVYCTASSIGVTGVLTLDALGDPNATFVFQAGSSLTTAGDVVLINGAQAKNVYWQVGSSATIGTASQFQGNILTLTSISLIDNATLVGRALARNGAVTLTTGNVITLP